ncbi:MAG: hypothetical protein ACTSW7_03995 [Candidatus Thorarchaeota archaeon]
MDIPILTKFIEGLKLFFASKRLQWLTFVFVIGAITIIVWNNLALMIPALGPIAIFVGGIFPTFFMITCFISLLGLARFVADEESYKRSFFLTIIWFVVSFFVLVMMFFIRPIFNWMFIGVAFLGWIGFQSYFSTRSSLGYAASMDIESRSKIVGLLYGFIYILNYVVIIGATLYTYFIINPVLPDAGTVLAVLGMLLALGFNFVNGLVYVAERKKSTASNIVFLGMFISFYSAYFIYNVLKGYDPGLDLVGIGITVFFILYTMSSVGRTLASRAELDTRFKISKELAATFTFFLASGFMFVDAMFAVILGVTNPTLEGGIGDAIKLLVFPFVAFIMVLNFIRKSRKAPEVAPVPEQIPIMEEEPEEEPMMVEPEVTEVESEEKETPEEEPTSMDEVIDNEDTSFTEEEEEPVIEKDSESLEE